MYTFDEAEIKFKNQFFGGREYQMIRRTNYCVFPYNHTYQNEMFVENNIRVDALNHRVLYSNLVIRYKDTLEHITESPWVSAGYKLENGDFCLYWNKKLMVHDGNHRIAANKKSGKNKMKVIMPESHYNAYIKNEELLCQE